MRLLRLLAIPLALGSLAAALSARQGPSHRQFSVAELFFELNDTGIHAAIDGGTWTSLEVEGPRDRQLLAIISKGTLRSQG